MSNEITVTKSYVMKENGAEYTLEYCIFSQAGQNNAAEYGITIRQSGADITLTESAVVSKNREKVIGLIYCFAKNFVFLCSLHDLIADMGQTDHLISLTNFG